MLTEEWLGTVEELPIRCLTAASCAQHRAIINAAVAALRDDNGEDEDNENDEDEHEDEDIFSEFPQQTDDELQSDETLSITTDISEEDQQVMMLDTSGDDIFVEEVVIGEEAFADELMPERKKICKEFKKVINIVSAVLSNIGMVVSSLNKASHGAGYIKKIDVQQYLNKDSDFIYNAMRSEEGDEFAGDIWAISSETAVKFQFHSLSNGQPPSIEMQVDGFRATFDDAVLKHLSAFMYDDQRTSVPLNFKINVINTQIIVKIRPKGKTIPSQIKRLCRRACKGKG
ncbi:unnamed protein product [Acanthocheilonema viteae]|uniref:Uncharacterized protein n=1 Tax=Acanthocheilonema viteae TaxID=6277 RepID=A0A498SC05_ACAVI|nr:unnamed protein product [Acanthocheilonema viteae]